MSGFPAVYWAGANAAKPPSVAVVGPMPNQNQIENELISNIRITFP